MITDDDYKLVLKLDFLTYLERVFYETRPETKLQLGPAVQVMASKLEACRHGTIRRLIITIPPRHLKSHSASVAFSTWLLGHTPSLHVICTSYGQELANTLARDAHKIMLSPLYKGLFSTRLSRETADDLETTQTGRRIATSVGGVLTGRGADFIIIDDPIKPDEALSETARNAVNKWYDNTLQTRLNDKTEGCIIIVMQRLHQDDLVGHVRAQGDWHVVDLPAIAEQEETHEIASIFGTHYFHRKPGDLLDPVREPRTKLDELRQTLGEFNFSAQYQQRPIPVGGAIIKAEWLQFYMPSHLPKFSFKLLSLDTANKAKEVNDFSVATIWGYADKKKYLLNVMRKRLEFPALKKEIIMQAKQHDVDTTLIEDRASGTQLLQDLKESGLFGLEAYEPQNGSDKVMRLHAQTTQFESGLVFLPTEASWLAEYVRELTGFPGTKFDDQVDSTTQALDYMRKNDSLDVWLKLAG